MSALSEAALACQKKMQQAKVSVACQNAFLANLRAVELGGTGFLPEESIMPATGLPVFNGLGVPASKDEEEHLLERTVVMKLNGGLGTGMGLDGPKSLLVVKEGQTFMDYIVQHIQATKDRVASPEQLHKKRKTNASGEFEGDHASLRFMLMNSFSTTTATQKFLDGNYKDLGASMKNKIELMQNQVPKVLQSTLFPAEWPEDPQCEWVPPGHGDLYVALYGSGKLDELVNAGYRYMFVSNSDNLGATVETRILKWMEDEKIPFVMEVCTRTEADRKGGHLARNKKNPSELLLRESAQCPPEEENLFQDIKRHCFFNTNNLWINLLALKDMMEKHNGVLQLPVIRNSKTVDPTNSASPKVYQLETAMGAAISNFTGAAALVVPRERFTPVKTCSDLLTIRSDAYITTEDKRLVLHPSCKGQPPVVRLDDHYKLLKNFEPLVTKGVPSLLHCHHLKIKGLVQFGGEGIVLKGDVTIENKAGTTQTLVVPPGTVLENTTYTG